MSPAEARALQPAGAAKAAQAALGVRGAGRRCGEARPAAGSGAPRTLRGPALAALTPSQSLFRCLQVSSRPDPRSTAICGLPRGTEPRGPAAPVPNAAGKPCGRRRCLLVAGTREICCLRRPLSEASASVGRRGAP